MKYCRHCGNELQDDDLFCPKCGTKQIVSEEEPKLSPEVEPKKSPIPEPELARVATPPNTSVKPQSIWQKGKGETKLNAKDSIIFTAAYSVFYIVYAILSPLMPTSMYISRIFFIPIFGAHLAIMIVRMVKCINRKMKFLSILHICFTGIAAAMVIGAFILLATASNA